MRLFRLLPQSRAVMDALGWAARTAWHLLLVFLARHWLLAVANAGLTALLGLALLRLVPSLGAPGAGQTSGFQAFLFRDVDLRLRRFLLAAALCKGAFYLVLGDGHRFLLRHATPIAYGFQMPSPGEVFRLLPQNPETIWRPTAASAQVGVLLCGLALALLVRRARQVRDLLAWLEALAPGGREEATVPARTRVRASLDRAGSALGLPPSAPLPRPLMAEVPVPTPLLVGLRRPYVLLAPSLVAALTDAELDAALRHELAHFRRRDHWWRWLLLWAEDVGRANPLSHWLCAQAMEREEDICDRWAVASAPEAAALGRAITKSRAHPVYSSRPLAGAGPGRVTPQLLGAGRSSPPAALERRLSLLLALAATYRVAPDLPGRRPAGRLARIRAARPAVALLLRLWTLLVACLVLAVIYTKFLLIPNVQ